MEIFPDQLDAPGNLGTFLPKRAVHIADVGIKHAARAQSLQQIHQMGGIACKIKGTSVDDNPHFIFYQTYCIFQHIIVPLLLLGINVSPGFDIISGIDKVYGNTGRLILI